jgi:SHS2 domain-containing protein
MSGVNNVIILESEEEASSLIKCIERSIYYLSTAYVIFRLVKVKHGK